MFFVLAFIQQKDVCFTGRNDIATFTNIITQCANLMAYFLNKTRLFHAQKHLQIHLAAHYALAQLAKKTSCAHPHKEQAFAPLLQSSLNLGHDECKNQDRHRHLRQDSASSTVLPTKPHIR